MLMKERMAKCKVTVVTLGFPLYTSRHSLPPPPLLPNTGWHIKISENLDLIQKALKVNLINPFEGHTCQEFFFLIDVLG